MPIRDDPALPLAELAQIERIIEAAGAAMEVRVACNVEHASQPLPVYALSLGTTDPARPAFGLFGGVHGLERIGSRVVIAFLQNIVTRLPWDAVLRETLERVRLVVMPVVNPGGMARGTRANPRGVDLMRNAPVEAREAVPFLVGGQRLSAGLPWYRGAQGAPMEAESQALCDTVVRELLPRPFSIALDCHSGFGMRDRLWFPYAYRRTPPPWLHHLHALHAIFDASYAHHPYVFEPQSRQYLAHGDLWDHLALQGEGRAGHVFLPLTLEMGSWLWVKKNPRQLFSRNGIFNPLIEHREQRVLRRHMPLLEFAIHAAAGWQGWVPHGAAQDAHRKLGLARWWGVDA